MEQTGDLVRRHRMDGVELRALNGTVDLVTYFTTSYGTPEALADKLRLGVRPSFAMSSERVAKNESRTMT